MCCAMSLAGRGVAVGVLAIGALLTSVPALADDGSHPESAVQAPLGADQIQFAAHEHDLGYRAYVAKQYDEAATHFENAFFAAPNPAELRYAIRARRDAAELARAATLAAIGQRKFSGDATTTKLADQVIAEARPSVYEVRIVSDTDCNVAVDEKIVAVEKVKTFRFFATPGKHKLRISWTDDRTTNVSIDAAPGGTQTLELEAPRPPAPTPPPPTPPPPAPAPDLVAPPPPVEGTPSAGSQPKPLGPPVFLVGAALTAVGVGVTIWSGIDTQNNPGPDTVKHACVGLGEACPDYKTGRWEQLRTNVLLAGTSGVAAATAVVGLFFTRWSDTERGAPPRGGGSRIVVEPVFGLGQAALRGTF
jgi:hypothetical protein